MSQAIRNEIFSIQDSIRRSHGICIRHQSSSDSLTHIAVAIAPHPDRAAHSTVVVRDERYGKLQAAGTQIAEHRCESNATTNFHHRITDCFVSFIDQLCQEKYYSILRALPRTHSGIFYHIVTTIIEQTAPSGGQTFVEPVSLISRLPHEAKRQHVAPPTKPDVLFRSILNPV